MILMQCLLLFAIEVSNSIFVFLDRHGIEYFFLAILESSTFEEFRIYKFIYDYLYIKTSPPIHNTTVFGPI